ncbi:MAG TPA: lmo0937 family membrane protein [Pseudogracilibacillus sp.]|nr:lmo0937 family membrane protein [Pseudogracilibacillus sp.]
MANIVWTLIGLLILFWLIGFVAKIGGGIIHFLLVIALVLLIFNLITGRRA